MAAALAVAGCTSPQGAAILGAVKDAGRAEAAAALDNAIWWKCRASPAGAVADRYFVTQERAELWVRECLGGKVDPRALRPGGPGGASPGF